MNTAEIKDLILVGFSKPKMYKRSVWNKTVKIMEHLADKGEVIRKDFGPGMEKYYTDKDVDSNIDLWALSYKRSLGEKPTLDEAVPELKVIATEMGLQYNNLKVLNAYFTKYPQDK